jgi:hypothetical protein
MMDECASALIWSVADEARATNTISGYQKLGNGTVARHLTARVGH